MTVSVGSELLQYLLTGLTLGGTYALTAVGFVLIYNVTRILNFTQGELVMLGALLMVTLSQSGLPLALAAVLAVVITAALAALFHRLALYPARKASTLTQLLITIGSSIGIRGLALLVWGANPYTLPAFSAGPPLSIGGAFITRQGLWVIALTAVMAAALFVFFEKTTLGKALQACSINPLAARLAGINPQLMALAAFALSGALAAVGGIAIAPMTSATYDMGLMLGLKGFVAAVLGGLTSLPGAIVGGILLGALEALGAGFISSAYKDAFAFLVLLVVLLVRPSGLLGRAEKERV